MAAAPYLLGARLRDLAEKHQDALRLNWIPTSEPSQFIGDKYQVAFERITESLARLMTLVVSEAAVAASTIAAYVPFGLMTTTNIRLASPGAGDQLVPTKERGV